MNKGNNKGRANSFGCCSGLVRKNAAVLIFASKIIFLAIFYYSLIIKNNRRFIALN